VQLFFTHIPKTAGTSFKKGVIYPNVSPDKILQFNGVKSLIRNRLVPFEYLDGHYPFGVHRFSAGATDPIYLTILREPVDRAVSQYYFIKQCDTKEYQHPDLPDANRCDLGGFYALQKFQNLQTKFTAGLLTMRLAGLFRGAVPDSLLLARAKYNLANRYHFVGLKERLSEFGDLVARKLGWRHLNVRDHSKSTRNRPTIHSITDETRTAILRGNQLDVQLYQFAEKLVAERLRG